MLNIKKGVFLIILFFQALLSFGQVFEPSSNNLLPLYSGKIQWADLDNDTDLDLIYSGFQFEVSDGFATHVYENIKGSFNLRTTNIPHLRNGTMALGDYDKDGDLDILISGLINSSEAITHIYKNNGGFSFSLFKTFPGLFNSTTSWFDMENDGDLDFLVSGILYYIDNEGNGIEKVVLHLYENIVGDFFLIENSGITPLTQSAVDWADRNGDGKIDLAITGLDSDFLPVTEVFLNNGNKSFTKDASENFEDLYNGDIKWGDFDNDGDMDIIHTGYSYDEYVSTTVLYENTGSEWKEPDHINLVQTGGSYFGGVKWFDFDNDGYLDILLAGANSSAQYFFKLYKNNGGENFEEVANLAGIAEASVDFGDYDNDGDLDVCYMGNTPTGSGTGIYNNLLLSELLTPNTQPTPPSVNSFSETNHYRKEFTLSWGIGSDIQTPSLGLSHNYYLRNESTVIVAPTSNFNTGYILTHNPTNGHANRAIVNDVPEGLNYWSVQSIDGSKWGSQFSNEKSFYQINGPETIKTEIIDLENVKLTWIDNSSVETSYHLVRSTELLSGYSLIASLKENEVSYIDNTPFLTDTYYYYRIYAVNINKVSGYDSLRVLIPTPANNLDALSVNASTITLTWDDQSIFETGYQIERKLSSDINFQVVATLNAGTELYTDTELNEGTSYDYRVRALNEFGSVSSEQSSAQTNFRPLGENFELTTLEDETLVFEAQEFKNVFSDPDATDQLIGIVIYSLPQNGILKLNGANVAIGQSIQVSELETLSFVPTLNENGTATFSFYNNDGKDNSLSSYTATINITPVNDAPTLSIILDIEVNQDTEVPPITFYIGDIDDPIESLSIQANSDNQTLIQDSKITIEGNSLEKAINIILENGASGEAMLTLLLSDGMLTTSVQFNVLVRPVTGLPEFTENHIKVYPNPFNSSINISFKETFQQDLKIVVKDLIGRTMLSQKINDEELTISTSEISKGIYLLNIFRSNGELIFHKKIIKQ